VTEINAHPNATLEDMLTQWKIDAKRAEDRRKKIETSGVASVDDNLPGLKPRQQELLTLVNKARLLRMSIGHDPVEHLRPIDRRAKSQAYREYANALQSFADRNGICRAAAKK
jgi:hypothetical protein